MTERLRLPSSAELLVVLVAVAVAAGAGAEASHVRLRTLLSVVILVGLFVVARQEWGSVAVAGVPFLLPDLPAHFGLSGSMQLTLLTATVAVVYWDTIGRPPVSHGALLGAAAFAAATIMLTAGNGFDLQSALWISLAAPAGILFGTCLAASSTARMALGIGCIPLALLALAEIGGFHNPWPGLVHAKTFLGLTSQAGAQRGQSTFGHPLIAGGCLATLSAVALYSRTRFSTIIAAILAGGALATVSRSALLGLAVALACGIAMGRGQRTRRLLQAAGIVVFAAVVIAQIPALQTSLVNRLTKVKYTDQYVRTYAQTKAVADLNSRPVSLLLGGGVGAANAQLRAIGTVHGYTIFDNQYVTSLYDLGVLPMLVVAILLGRAIMVASPDARRRGLPALASVAAVMFFTDGGYWLSLGFLAWTTAGMCALPAARMPRRRTGALSAR